MIIEEIHYNIKLRSNKLDSQYKRDFNALEIDYILNDVINIFVDTVYSGNNPSLKGLEETQFRIDDISSLIIKSPFVTGITPSLVSSDNVYEFKLSSISNYRHLIGGEFVTTKNDCTKNIRLNQVQHDDLKHVLKDPYRKPSFEWERVPMVLAKDNTVTGQTSVYAYTQGDFTITHFKPEYIKNPSLVSIGGYNTVSGSPAVKTELDLPVSVHSRIIDLAVAEIKRILSSPDEYQLFSEKLRVNN